MKIYIITRKENNLEDDHASFVDITTSWDDILGICKKDYKKNHHVERDLEIVIPKMVVVRYLNNGLYYGIHYYIKERDI